MIITLRLFGTLINYFNGSRFEISCPPSTTYVDICDIINARWGKQLPPQVWDKEAKNFIGGVLVMIDKKDVGPLEPLLLSDGQEIYILLPISGGKILYPFRSGLLSRNSSPWSEYPFKGLQKGGEIAFVNFSAMTSKF